MRFPREPRWFQIAFLGSFLVAGLQSDAIPAWEPPLTVGTALLTQAGLGRWKRAPPGHLLSGAITGLGLTLLLRSDIPWIPPLAAVGAIASKFLLRIKGKHVFNPANGALVGAMLLTTHVWCSPSQWGESTVLLFWFIALGITVSVRSLRSDISLAFLVFWLALKAGRVLYLGQRPQVLVHQVSIGSLIVFTFFMISDPKTTPDHRLARIAFAGLVAVLAFTLQHGYWIQNAPIWALAVLSPLVPLLDRLARSERYRWPTLTHEPACAPSSSPSL